MHIDASLTGLGEIWNQEVYSTPIFDIYDFQLKIVHLEMFNLVIALKLWGQKWAHMTVRFYCDNLAVVQWLTRAKLWTNGWPSASEIFGCWQLLMI